MYFKHLKIMIVSITFTTTNAGIHLVNLLTVLIGGGGLIRVPGKRFMGNKMSTSITYNQMFMHSTKTVRTDNLARTFSTMVWRELVAKASIIVNYGKYFRHINSIQINICI